MNWSEEQENILEASPSATRLWMGPTFMLRAFSCFARWRCNSGWFQPLRMRATEFHHHFFHSDLNGHGITSLPVSKVRPQEGVAWPNLVEM